MPGHLNVGLASFTGKREAILQSAQKVSSAVAGCCEPFPLSLRFPAFAALRSMQKSYDSPIRLASLLELKLYRISQQNSSTPAA